MNEMELSIVVPAYEEAESLKQILPTLQDVANGLTRSFEILVVDTMKPHDDTPVVCERLGVTYLPRRGGDLYGDAVRTGFTAARGHWVAMMDGDGSTIPWRCHTCGNVDTITTSLSRHVTCAAVRRKIRPC